MLLDIANEIQTSSRLSTN